jgi:threonine/homoserine/homoserine lactone efflux protein
MTFFSFLLFVPVYALAVASPGPAVAAVVARTLGRGTNGVFAFILGLVAGDLTWFAAATLGLTLIAQGFAPLFHAIKIAGAAYLAYIAWTIWRAPALPVDVDTRPDGGSRFSAFLGAYFLTLGNPKTMVFFVSIMPLVISPSSVSWLVAIELGATIIVVLSAIFLGYVYMANRARQVFRSQRALRVINRFTAGMMAGTALVVVTR